MFTVIQENGVLKIYNYYHPNIIHTLDRHNTLHKKITKYMTKIDYLEFLIYTAKDAKG